MGIKAYLKKLALQCVPGWMVWEIQRPVKAERDQLKAALADTNNSWAQEGEDLVLARFFHNQQKGFYVDVGAHHPQRFSNTFIFYQKGWRGINIDPNPETITLFEKARPQDINCNVGISENGDLLTYYMFNEPALNTFDKKLADEYCAKPEYHILETLDIKTEKLGTVLDRLLPADTQIDFLSIDAEGLDFEVLQSNDWTKYAPAMVLVEYLDFEMESFLRSALYAYMSSRGYAFAAKTYNTVFFKRK